MCLPERLELAGKMLFLFVLHCYHMNGFWKRLSEKWSNWIGDRDLELALRRHLSGEGYYGDSASFQNLRLAAVQRPGWVQVFIFTVQAKLRSDEASETHQLFGVAMQDERYSKLSVRTFSKRHLRNAKFRDWSSDLIRLRNNDL